VPHGGLRRTGLAIPGRKNASQREPRPPHLVGDFAAPVWRRYHADAFPAHTSCQLDSDLTSSTRQCNAGCMFARRECELWLIHSIHPAAGVYRLTTVGQAHDVPQHYAAQ